MDDRKNYAVSDSGIDEFGGVWVTVIGPDYRKARRLAAAHSRKNGWGRWISGGASFSNEGRTVEVHVRYHPGKP